MIKILKFGEVSANDIFARTEPTVNVEAVVSEIIENVKKNGDKALYEYSEKLEVGPTPASPGPMLLSVAATAVKFVVKSRLSTLINKIDTASIVIYAAI